MHKTPPRRLRILLVHQNFPGQFRHLAPTLAANHEAVAFTMNDTPSTANMRVVRYQAARGTTAGVHPYPCASPLTHSICLGRHTVFKS
jgi:hypothetical protein